MYRFSRRFRTPPYDGSPVDFVVYEKKEADELGISYRKDWRYARPGEWCLTDDEYVGELVIRRKMKRKEGLSFEFVFSFAQRIVTWVVGEDGKSAPSSRPDLHFGPHAKRGIYGGATPAPWIEKELRSTRAKRAIELWCVLMLSTGGKLTQREWDMIGKTYRPKQKIPRATVRKLFRDEATKQMARARLDEILAELGINELSVATVYNKALQIALEQRDPGKMIQANDRLRDLVREAKRETHSGIDTPWKSEQTDPELEEGEERPALERPRQSQLKRYKPSKAKVAENAIPVDEEKDDSGD